PRRRGSAALGALGDGADEVGELVAQALELGVLAVRARGGRAMAAGAGLVQVGDRGVELTQVRVQVIGEQRLQRRVRPAVDADESDEALLGAREREVDGAVFVEGFMVWKEP